MDALRARFPHVLVLAFEPEGVLREQRGYRARTLMSGPPGTRLSAF